jgi:hypothetical protein
VALVVVVVALLGGGGYLGWRAFAGDSTSPAAEAPPACTTPSPEPSPRAAGEVTLIVLNATPRVGLAHIVAEALRARGFRLGRVGNTTTPVTGVAAVAYPPGMLAAAKTVAEQIPGATLHAAAASVTQSGAQSVAGRIEVDLGPAFRRLATPAQVASARAVDLAAAAPSPPVCPTRTP